MQVISIFIAFLAVTRLAVAQSQTGYNYPSPFNPLTPGSQSDIGGSSSGLPSAQQPSQPSTPFAGSQSGFNNQPSYSPSVPQGPPSFNAAPTLTPGFNQPPFGQPTASSLPPVGGISANIPVPNAGSFGPSSSAGYPAATAPTKGFEGGFPHSGSGHSSGSAHSSGAGHLAGGSHSSGGSHSGAGGHLPAGSHSSGGSHSGSGGFGGTPSTFPSASGFPGLAGDSGSTGFGAPGFSNQGGPANQGQGQSSFGSQPTNFGGQTGGSGNGQFDDGSYNGGDYSAIPGTPGVDYPIYTEIPKTSFDCKNQQFPGYYADTEAQCQVFHICALNTTFNFLCPNGTIFSQESLVCVWWNQFNCNDAPGLYGNNAYIYDYSKTGQQSDGSNAGFGVQGPSNSFDGGFGSSPQSPSPSAPGFGAQPGPQQGFGTSQPSAPGFAQPGSSGFGSSQTGSSAFGPSSAPGFGAPSSAPGFGPSSAPGFVTPSSSAVGSAGYPASNSPSGTHHDSSTGFGQPGSSHSTGFGQAHGPSSGSSHTSHTSHTSSHNVPSSHSYPSSSGGEQYPGAAPPSPADYQPSAIVPTIPSSPAPFAGGVTATGYPPAGTPNPINTPLNTPLTGLTGEQPSREYLPSRRTK